MRNARFLAVMMAAAMAVTPVFAAESPTTSNIDTLAIVEVVQKQEASAEKEPWIIPKDETTISACKMEISSDYDGLDKTVYTSTALLAPRNETTETLKDYVLKKAVGKKKFCPLKLQMYKNGESIWDGFGTVTYRFQIGSVYDGKTAVVYQIHKDGRITEEEVKVSNGIVVIKLEDMGTFIITV